MKLKIKNIIITIAYTVIAISSYAQNDNKNKHSEILYSIYLIGDLRTDSAGLSNLNFFKKYSDADSSKKAVIILGDILYPFGLPDSSEKNFPEAEKNLKKILEIFKPFNGKIFMLPGNHDWAKGKKDGYESVKNEEKYIEQYLNKGNVYRPDNACSGPEEINLSEDITLIIFDSQQWFQKNTNQETDQECIFKSEADLYLRIDDILNRNKNKKIIFATHHPLYSIGKHGGYFPLSDYIFPLRNLNPALFIPLPGIIYTGYRKYLGNIQDTAHPEYKEFIRLMTNVFKKYPDVIYAAGHEHNLQYINKNGLRHIISGSGGKASFTAKKNNKTNFAYSGKGFGKLIFFKNGDVKLEFITSERKEKIIFEKTILNKPVYNPEKEKKYAENFRITDTVVKTKINDKYDKVSKFRRFMTGNNYRNIWAAETEFPVFDIRTQKGGLSIIKRGGGQQTFSLRMKNPDNKQYVLRSINKSVEKALPPEFRNTAAVDILQDGVSASNPFAAVVVPVLADAAGIMHTNPEIFWIPDDPGFGIYQDKTARQVFLFEERPAGNRKDVASFGNSEKIISTTKVIKKIHKNADCTVDQKAVMRARIFDILLNDWDRHDDQWRWAEFKTENNKIYKPIPRDRDQVFFVNEGLAMKILKQKWIARKFQGFNDSLKDVEGLAFNARHFDRTFITEPDLNDWKKTAEDIKLKITDSVIKRAISQMPENICDSIGNFTEEKLKYRLKYLPEYAEKLYKFLAKAVDVTGTNKNDLFEVKRKKNGNTEVTVYTLHKNKPEKQIYKREFIKNETKEIRLYGLKGKDTFVISGKSKKGIKIRIIGGKGNDTFIDTSHVAGLNKKTIIYDRKDKKNKFVTKNETRMQLSKNKSINKYDRFQFKYDKTIPLLYFGYKIDDGAYIGIGTKIKKYNFRDSIIQKITGNIAFKTGAFSFKYNGLFSSISQNFDLSINAELNFPRNVNNFYGLGNETVKTYDSEYYYRLRYKHIMINPALKKTTGKNFNYALGIFYKYYELTDTAGRFIGDIAEQLPASAFNEHNYTGINTEYTVNTLNNKIRPERGILWKTKIAGFYDINKNNENFVKINSDIRLFLSFRKDPRIVLALRFGGAVNIGEYDFMTANFLGGKTNLRGFRADRFAGDAYLFQNTEIRFKIKNIRTYLLNGEAGIMIFNDTGKVFYENQDSPTWHDGYGAGIWLIPFNFTALTLTYNKSVEDNFINFGFSYTF